MKQYLLEYRRGVTGGYNHARDYFQGGPDVGDDDGYLAPGHYETDEEAKYAAIARKCDVERRWPEFNKYPYGDAQIWEREVGGWQAI
jgi:hypothetical protein